MGQDAGVTHRLSTGAYIFHYAESFTTMNPVIAAPQGPTEPTGAMGPAGDASEDTDADSQVIQHAAKPGWFTPLRLLIIFCLANVMVYLDRGEYLL